MLWMMFGVALAAFPADLQGRWALDGIRSDNGVQQMRAYARAVGPAQGSDRFSPDAGKDSVQEMSQKAWDQLMWLVNQSSETKFRTDETALFVTYPAEQELELSKKWSKVKLERHKYKVRVRESGGQVIIERRANGNRVVEIWLPISEDGTRGVVVSVGSSVLQGPIEFRRVYRPLHSSD